MGDEQALVQLQGKPFFAEFDLRSRNIRLYGFDERLAPFLACKISMGTPRRESIRSATDRDLCEAVLAGRVSGAPIDDIERTELPPEALRIASDKTSFGGGGRHSLVGRGRLDVDNDGAPDDVGIVEYDDASGAGCGHDYRESWPVKLNPDGMPAAGLPFNYEARKVVGGDDESRLFIFRGTTYYERRSLPTIDGIPEHEVWKFTPSGPVPACVFNAVTYAVSEIAF